MPRTSNKILFLMVVVLLFFWVQRFWALDTFPIFIDEATHIHYGERISETGPLAYSNEGRQLTYWYLLLFQPAESENPIFVARVATLLIVLLGFTAFITSGRLLAGTTGLIFAALVYLLSTYHFFFDRLAMADTLSSALILVAVYLGLRLQFCSSLWDALFLGASLFVAILFKASALPFLGIPIAAALLTFRPTLTIRQRLTWGIVALGTAGILLALWWGLLEWRGYEFLGLFGVHNSSGLSSNRWLNNITLARMWLLDYFSLPVLLLVLGLSIYALIKRQWYLLLVAFAPLFTTLLNARQTPRYWMGSVSVMLLILAVGLAWLTQQYPRVMRIVSGVLLAIWALFTWLPFVLAAYQNPVAFPLPEREYNEYLVADASGFGLPEVAEILREVQPERIIGLLSNCWGLEYTAPDLSIECPRINPTGEDIPILQELIAAAEAGTVVVYEDSNYVPEVIPGEVIAEIPRPGGRANLTVYRLTE